MIAGSVGALGRDYKEDARPGRHDERDHVLGMVAILESELVGRVERHGYLCARHASGRNRSEVKIEAIHASMLRGLQSPSCTERV